MSANIDTMLYVGETPWHGLGTKYDTPPKSSKEIIEGAKLGWEVGTEKMTSFSHGEIPGYHTIFRKDDMSLMGVAHVMRPHLVQNTETFEIFDPLLDKQVDFETAASLGHGEIIFGCFQVKDGYKILDDDFDHYFVVVNDHLKADGKVTIFNTPVRVVCQNTLNAALNRSMCQLRMPVTSDEGVKLTITNNIFDRVQMIKTQLTRQADKLVGQKVDRDYVAGLLDELFPMVKSEGDSSASRANERMDMIRSQFLSDCMNADNLGNYRGTSYQCLQAVADFSTHYFYKPDKAFDLESRMKVIPGLFADSPSQMVNKFLAYNKRKMA